ncbi:hypothetical protein BV25DRAFT_1771644, partial [Artomyces pyxidatus]
VIDLGDFLSVIAQQKDTFSIIARVDAASLKGVEDCREKADKVAELVWQMTNYRFIYSSLYDHKRSPGTTRLKYSCAQNRHRQ